MPRTYTLLLHDTVRAYLLSLGGRARQRLCEKLEFLQHGLWDTGVRVKKLKGAARAVFEARLNRGARILFTLGRGADGATPIYVWGVVQHDDVSAAVSWLNHLETAYPARRENALLLVGVTETTATRPAGVCR